jgi:hypothetical protein
VAVPASAPKPPRKKAEAKPALGADVSAAIAAVDAAAKLLPPESEVRVRARPFVKGYLALVRRGQAECSAECHASKWAFQTGRLCSARAHAVCFVVHGAKPSVQMQQWPRASVRFAVQVPRVHVPCHACAPPGVPGVFASDESLMFALASCTC